MNLLSLSLQLQPTPTATRSHPCPLWWGRAAHALLLNTVRQYDPRLAQSLHATAQAQADASGAAVENALRPFTASTLIGRFNRQGEPDANFTYHLRLTSIQPELTRVLWQAAQDGPLCPGAQVELDYYPFQVLDVQPTAPDQQSSIPDQPSSIPDRQSKIGNQKSKIQWFGASSYTEISAAYLLAKETPPRRIGMQFASPTVFKTSGRHMPFPLPELVFGSLLEKWNAFAPVTFPPELRRYAAECLAISRYHMHSKPIPLKSGSLRMGGVGEVTYATLNYDRYWMSLLCLLAEFALYAGVGAGTSMGLGQARREGGWGMGDGGF